MVSKILILEIYLAFIDIWSLFIHHNVFLSCDGIMEYIMLILKKAIFLY